jgi:hypothetical protein
MLAKACACAVVGLEGALIEVEVVSARDFQPSASSASQMRR